MLPFRIDYVNTIKVPEGVADKQVSGIDTERALLAPERIAQVVGYIREHFDQKTRRTGHYKHRILTNITEVVAGKGKGEEKKESRRLHGFNSLLATASIDAAKRYYAELKSQQQDVPQANRLKIGLIYSFAPNEAEADGVLAEEGFETDALDQASRDFLDAAIEDYNALFGTSFDTSADKFQNYYKDMSLRLKNREIDLVIVVNMFLTGFDATTLNTLWVDKSLRSHGLIQAYSRTNRILNSVKTYGNIVSFRDLEEATNDAIALFGNKDARGIVVLKPYSEYYGEYAGKGGRAAEELPAGRDADHRRGGAEGVHRSVRRHPAPSRTSWPHSTSLSGDELLTDRQVQDYRSDYLDTLRRVPQGHGGREGIDQRRRGVRDRANQAGRDHRRLHPAARPTVPRTSERGQGQGDPGRDPASH